MLGLDVHTEMGRIRRLIGVCQQMNVLYDRLTVRQHLRLFAHLKGLDVAATDAAVAQLIRDADMGAYAGQYVESLSGGQKRKVSVCLALLGSSRVVFLDEPTAGMDPASRRSIWALLERAKAGRLIILTTHSLDEADRLSDRIGIIAAGRLQCCGSSLFLKRRLGAGYSLDVLHEPDGAVQQSIVQCVQAHIADAEVVSRSSMEVKMKVRFDAAPAFPALLEQLDAARPEWRINAVSMQATTLEEIFIRVVQDAMAAQSDEQQQQKEEKADDAADDSSDSRLLVQSDRLEDAPRLGTAQLFFLQLQALFLKRWVHSRRSPRMWRLAIGAPVFLAVVGMLVRRSFNAGYPSKLLTAADYSPVRLPLYAANASYALPDALWSSLGVDRPIRINSTDLGLPTAALSNATYAGMAGWLSASATGGQGPFYGAFGYDLGGGGAGSRGPQLVTWFNTTTPFALPSFLNLFDTALLRHRTGVATAAIEASIRPFPSTQQEQSLVNAFTTPILVSIALSMVSAFFAFYAVYERKVGIAHLQRISGLYPAAYWLGHWAFDFCTYLLSAALVLGALAAFGLPELLGGQALPVTLLAALLFGLAVVPAMYVLSLPFKEPVFAQGMLTALSVIAAGYAPLILLVLDLIGSKYAQLKWIFRLLPPYCLGEVMLRLCSRSVLVLYGDPLPVWSFDLVGWPLLYLAVDAALFPAVLALHAYWPHILKLLRAHLFVHITAAAGGGAANARAPPLSEADPEVVREKERLSASSGPVPDEQVTVRGLRQVYGASGKRGPIVALDDVFLSVRNNECLGLLGVNGAGKTSLLKILTTEMTATSGSVLLAGVDPTVSPHEVYARTAYCPQFDALLEELSGRDHLLLFARLRGLHGAELRATVARLVARLDLQAGIIDRPVSEYSGGNKRKLCVGVALVGGPHIVLLDEPSTGVDPFSRRLMWALIASTMRQRSVILTSHMMEEVAALCQRIAILSRGRMQALGSAAQLIERYGDGYEVHIACKSGGGGRDVKADVVAEVQRSLPEAVCPQLADSTLKWMVPASARFADGQQVSSGRLFGWAEQLKRQFTAHERDTLEYVIQDQTLEQVFLRLAARDGVQDEQ